MIRAAIVGMGTWGRHLAASVQRRDNISLRLRVGLNSGRVVAGEIGSGVTSYAAIGETGDTADRNVIGHGPLSSVAMLSRDTGI